MDCGFIDDGYTKTGYVKDLPGIYPAVRFTYRPTTKAEVAAVFAEWRNLDNKEQMAVTAKLLAKHLQTWDLKDHQGRSVKCKDPGLIARLSPQLFDKVGDIVTGAVASDADPQGGDKPSDGEAFAETGLGNSNPG